MAVYLTGDIHGMIDDPERFEVWNWPEGDELTRNDYLIVLGDFGMPFDLLESDADLRALNAKPWTTLFIDGNHEYFPYLEHLDEEEWHGGIVHRYPQHRNIIHLMRGEVYELDGRTFFCMGGAQSVDKSFQQANGTWFPEELPDSFDYENATRNLEQHDWKVDFVLSHTCASRMVGEAIGDTGLPGVGIMTDELTDFFDELEDRLEFEHWFFGHFHNDSQLDGQHSVLYQDIVDVEDYC